MSKFDQLTEKLAAERTKRGAKKVSNPKALAAYIGRQKYGNAGMAKKAAAGRMKEGSKAEEAADRAGMG